MRLIVTGATGFVGRHLVPALVDEHELICVVRNPSATTPLGRVTLVKGDIGDPRFVRGLPQRADCIIHLAQAYVAFPGHATEIFRVNAAGTQWLAEYGRSAGVTRFLFASSGSVYRPSRRPLSESAPTGPSAYHPATKLMSELALNYYGRYFSTAVLRLFTPYGPGQVNRLIPRLIASVRAGESVRLSRGGEPRINPIYVDDLTRILVQALGDNRSYTVNVAGPRAVSIRQLATMIGRRVRREPNFLADDSEIAGDLVADTRLMRTLFALGALVSPGDGLTRTIGSETGRRQ